jgi:hypothetical protein
VKLIYHDVEAFFDDVSSSWDFFSDFDWGRGDFLMGF